MQWLCKHGMFLKWSLSVKEDVDHWLEVIGTVVPTWPLFRIKFLFVFMWFRKAPLISLMTIWHLSHEVAKCNKDSDVRTVVVTPTVAWSINISSKLQMRLHRALQLLVFVWTILYCKYAFFFFPCCRISSTWSWLYQVQEISSVACLVKDGNSHCGPADPTSVSRFILECWGLVYVSQVIMCVI